MTTELKITEKVEIVETNIHLKNANKIKGREKILWISNRY